MEQFLDSGRCPLHRREATFHVRCFILHVRCRFRVRTNLRLYKTYVFFLLIVYIQSRKHHKCMEQIEYACITPLSLLHSIHV